MLAGVEPYDEQASTERATLPGGGAGGSGARLTKARAAVIVASRSDALLYGELRYGEEFSQVEATLDRLGLRRSPDTFRKYKWVARSVPPERRRDDLSFSAHQQVAGLDPAAQVELLQLAAEKRWGSRPLQVRQKCASARQS